MAETRTPTFATIVDWDANGEAVFAYYTFAGAITAKRLRRFARLLSLSAEDFDTPLEPADALPRPPPAPEEAP